VQTEDSALLQVAKERFRDDCLVEMNHSINIGACVVGLHRNCYVKGLPVFPTEVGLDMFSNYYQMLQIRIIN
jgi:hypothetical protein